MPFQGLHRFERGVPVAGHAQVVAVDVDRVRQAQVVAGLGHAFDDLPRRDVEVLDVRVEPVDVAALLLLPDFDAAGVDELGRVTLGRPSSQAMNAFSRSGLVAPESPA